MQLENKTPKESSRRTLASFFPLTIPGKNALRNESNPNKPHVQRI